MYDIKHGALNMLKNKVIRGGRKGGKQGPGPPLKYSAPVIYIYIYIR
jgi:hypothetical protein